MTRQVNPVGQERDWTEWQALVEVIHSIQSTHQATLELRLKASTSGYVSFVDVDVCATLPILIGPAQPLRLSLLSHYPHPKHSTLASLLREMLARVETRIGAECYKQRKLPIDPTP